MKAPKNSDQVRQECASRNEQPFERSFAGSVRELMLRGAIGLIRLYRLVLSPLLGANCRFQPTCSAYAIEALQCHGLFKGSKLVVWRLARCHPWGGSGFDPVPVAAPSAHERHKRDRR